MLALLVGVALAYDIDAALADLVAIETDLREGRSPDAAVRLRDGIAMLEEPLPRIVQRRMALAVGTGLVVSGETVEGDAWLSRLEIESADAHDALELPAPLRWSHDVGSQATPEALSAVPAWVGAPPGPEPKPEGVVSRGAWDVVLGAEARPRCDCDGREKRSYRVLWGLRRGIRVGRPLRRVVYGGCVVPAGFPKWACPSDCAPVHAD